MGVDVALDGCMFMCPDCAPDELMPLQLAANARGAIVGLLTLALLLVLAVVVAGACLKYTRRLLLAGATLLGAGLGTVVTGAVLQRILPLLGIVPWEVSNSVARRGEWLWEGDFYIYGFSAVVLGLIVATTEARNVIAVTRNRLVPGGILAGWGLLSIVASAWLARTFEWSKATFAGASAPFLLLGYGVLGAAIVVMGVRLIVSVLSHHTHARRKTPQSVKVAVAARISKQTRHAH